MSRVIHFEINVDDPDRAVSFYGEVFGWETQKWDGPQDYWLVTTGAEGEAGINGALMKRGDPPETTVNTISVDDIDATLEKVQTSGGMVVAPKMTVPGVGYAAYCKDSEGNTLGLMQDEPSVE
jgi:predicted enzyme related to lactoylglutathione lyase